MPPNREIIVEYSSSRNKRIYVWRICKGCLFVDGEARKWIGVGGWERRGWDLGRDYFLRFEILDFGFWLGKRQGRREKRERSAKTHISMTVE